MFRATGRVANYDLVRVIGRCRGAAGIVYLGIDRTTKRRVLIKVMHPVGNDDVREIIEAEARGAMLQQLLSLRTNAVPAVYDWGFTVVGFYIAMEYIDGDDLDQRIGNGRRLAPECAAAVVRDICDCLTIAHSPTFFVHGVQSAIIHADLKPANVRLAFRGGAKLLDFGNAATVPVDGAAPRARWMTPQYAPPECITAGRMDLHTDLWATGVMLYEAIAGRCPDELDHAPLPQCCPRPLARIVEKILAARPCDRYQSANALRADLDRFLIASGGSSSIAVRGGTKSATARFV